MATAINQLRNHPHMLDVARKGKKVQSIKVDELRKYVNGILSMDGYSQDGKAALCVMLENVLHETGNYHGYGYIGWMEGGYQRWLAAGKPEEEKGEYRGKEYDRVYY
jgi:hypothetical protein